LLSLKEGKIKPPPIRRVIIKIPNSFDSFFIDK